MKDDITSTISSIIFLGVLGISLHYFGFERTLIFVLGLMVLKLQSLVDK